MHAQQAWLVVAGVCKIPSFPIVAPYIAIKTEPMGFSLTEVSSKVFDIQKENYTETFSNILESATLFLNYINTHIEELSKWFWRFGNVETTQWIE